MRYNTLYVCRRLLNQDEVHEWARKHGFDEPHKTMHSTIAYSRSPVNWDLWVPRKNIYRCTEFPRSIKKLGEQGAIVLTFYSLYFHIRHEEFRKGGCSWDWQGYTPHVTISYKDRDIANIQPFRGELLFGEEEFNTIDEGAE